MLSAAVIGQSVLITQTHTGSFGQRRNFSDNITFRHAKYYVSSKLQQIVLWNVAPPSSNLLEYYATLQCLSVSGKQNAP